MNMKWDNHGMKTPLARARGLGASHAAVPGWIRLRVTAIGTAVLSLWFLWFLSQTIGTSHAEFTAKLADPRNAICMLLLIIAAFTHAVLGNREIVEDYIHNEFFKLSKLVGMYLFFFALATACIFSILKIAL
ncbi:MAG TPA: succinate dehydrogenase, hydrophobic membrane anchor protein [Alphaproteobacteria bacterium]|nr:succinate dehydrogenase, hydrophobic membrane anchor protein [Alphaproteobacteria bacterium]USO04855.1 MAG: succinate dehydrogenase, hydrophobic membrane anchor protein [Rhodospirillales bacterium]HOO82368.1 succinate dehydrogenase, hydrophobic membrane anchor protein [Alphaproteobacteria bacterium]